MAWLHATPKDDKLSRFAQFKARDHKSPQLNFPDLEGAGYLLDLWREAGTVTQTGMGIAGLDWPAITSWANDRFSVPSLRYVDVGDGISIPMTFLECSLSDWEKLAIFHMSGAYASEYSQASERDRPAPYTEDVLENEEEFDRAALEASVLSQFRALMKNKER